MAVRRARHEFWGSGPAYRAIGEFTFHRLAANAPEHEVERHTHDEAHFVLVLSGSYKSSAVGAPPVSRTPLLLFNPAGTTHEDRFLSGEGSFLAVSGGRDEGLGPATRLYDPYAIWAAHGIAAQFDRSGAVALDFDGRAHQLLASVVPFTSDESRDAVQPPAWLKRAFEMSFTADDPDLKVADLAAEVGVHPVHLARVFKRYLHCSPGEHLRGLRLERAAALIGGSTASLSDIAYAAGFADQAHLNTAFRRAFQTTPAAWRRDVARIQDRRPGPGQGG